MPSISLNLGNNQLIGNNLINLNLQIKDDTGGQIIVKSIKGIENFDIVGQSQSQSSSTSIVSINGKTQQKTTTTYNITLSLKPKKNGEITIGPAIVSINNKTYKSNSIKINITKSSIPTINQSNNQITSNNIQTNPNQVSNSQQGFNTEKQVENIKPANIQTHNYYGIVSLLMGLIVLGAIILYKGLQNSKTENIEEQLSKEEDISTNNFQVSSNSNDFLTLLSQKYNINLHTKTYSEIKELLKDKLTDEEKEKLEKLLIEQFKRNDN